MAIRQIYGSSPSNAPILFINTTGNNSRICLIIDTFSKPAVREKVSTHILQQNVAQRAHLTAQSFHETTCLRLPDDEQRAEVVLLMIDKLLKKARLGVYELAGIIVATGPGLFTSTKVGIAIANTLAWATKLPITGIKTDEFDNNGQGLLSIVWQASPRIILPTLQTPNITIKH